ncbi:MAG: AMMECR1 domain-containing protein [Candidatus Aenigmarchaeota archaeon]|nr:AMMECR1 domain-containing protein [Candidatus Aenigmarchaeota archaeon]
MNSGKLSLKDGELVIRFVRKAIEEWVKNNKTIHDVPQHPFFNERHGILLSIYYADGRLHGRIGYPYPIKSAFDVLVRCAMSVCQDPRSPALKTTDIANIKSEVSILSEPHAVLRPLENNFLPAKEGLIIVRGAKHAMMMPGDFDGKPVEAVKEIAKQAGIENSLINDGLTKFYKFESQTFFETSPNGKVGEKEHNSGKKQLKSGKPAKKPAKTKKKGRHK